MDKSIVKGKIYAFHSELMQPYGKGLKIVDGIAGDTVSVDPEETAINGSMVGEGLALAAESGHTEQELTRSGVVPNGRLWMMGRTRYSFDSV
jgi:conjugal transfer pilin signal peptidase TrbI